MRYNPFGGDSPVHVQGVGFWGRCHMRRHTPRPLAIAKLESGKGKNLELRTLVRYATALGARMRVVIGEDARLPKMRRVSRLAVVPVRKAKARSLPAVAP